MSLRTKMLYAAGILFLALAKAKNLLRGYSSPKPFDISETARCVEYDIHVVEHWLSHLKQYAPNKSISGKSILELGPGSDLGIGIYLLDKGCSQYYTCDVNNLMSSTPDSFYDVLFRRIESMNTFANIAFLKEQLRHAQEGIPSRLHYAVREDFDLVAAFGESKVDFVFSQAAFEHFDDIEETIVKLGRICRPGAIIVAEIDLRTHSRWIRDKDPNNIYRYQGYVYDAFWFRGIPNRVRPFQYKEAFERLGWTDVLITPISRLADYETSYAGMSGTFSNEKNQMDYLTIILCATRKK